MPVNPLTALPVSQKPSPLEPSSESAVELTVKVAPSAGLESITNPAASAVRIVMIRVKYRKVTPPTRCVSVYSQPLGTLGLRAG